MKVILNKFFAFLLTLIILYSINMFVFETAVKNTFLKNDTIYETAFQNVDFNVFPDSNLYSNNMKELIAEFNRSTKQNIPNYLKHMLQYIFGYKLEGNYLREFDNAEVVKYYNISENEKEIALNLNSQFYSQIRELDAQIRTTVAPLHAYFKGIYKLYWYFLVFIVLAMISFALLFGNLRKAFLILADLMIMPSLMSMAMFYGIYYIVVYKLNSFLPKMLYLPLKIIFVEFITNILIGLGICVVIGLIIYAIHFLIKDKNKQKVKNN